MIYENISALCKKRNISIAKLEREVGLGNGTIGRRVTSSPTVENVTKVAAFFEVPVAEILASKTPTK